MKRTMSAAVLSTVAILLSPCAQAVNIRDCSAEPSRAQRGGAPSEYDGYRSARAEALRPSRQDLYENREGRLPRAGRDEAYYEYDLGTDRGAGRGAHRVVILVESTARGRRIVESYFTQDHYDSFCRLRF